MREELVRPARALRGGRRGWCRSQTVLHGDTRKGGPTRSKHTICELPSRVS